MGNKVLSLSEVHHKQALEDAGTWFEYRDGGRFLVTYLGREALSAKQERLERIARAKHGTRKGKDLPTEAQREVTIRSMYGTTVLDWADIVDDDGKPYEFTEDNFYALLKDVRGLFAALVDYAAERENFHSEKIADDSGK